MESNQTMTDYNRIMVLLDTAQRLSTLHEKFNKVHEAVKAELSAGLDRSRKQVFLDAYQQLDSIYEDIDDLAAHRDHLGDDYNVLREESMKTKEIIGMILRSHK